MTTTSAPPSVRPLRDTVIIEHTTQEAIQNGVVLPESSRQIGNEGTVLAVGPGRWQDGERIPMEVEVGDRVLFRRWNASGLIYNGVPVLSMPESEILCVVDESADVSYEGVVTK